MSDATIRDLRNHGGAVIARVAAGEEVTVTRDGEPVARLVPLRRPALAPAQLVARFQALPPVDPNRLRRDVDGVLDQRL